MYGTKEVHITAFWRGNLEERATWKTQTQMNLFRLVQDSDLWRDFVNTVMNLRVPQSFGNFLTS